MKVKVVRKPAQPEREGINPFTKEKTIFKAKPAQCFAVLGLNHLTFLLEPLSRFT